MYRTYKYKLYQNSKTKKLHSYINTACDIYNHFIKVEARFYKLFKKGVHRFRVQKHITKLKNIAKKRIAQGKNDTKFAMLLNINSSVIVNITERIERAYKLFFTNVKKKVLCSPPKEQKRSYYTSITLKSGSGFKVIGPNVFKIMGVEYKFFKDRMFNINDKIALVTIKRDLLNEIYVYVIVDEEMIPVQNNNDNNIRIDFNLDKFIDIKDIDNSGKPIDDNVTTIDLNDPIKASMNMMISARTNWERHKNDNRTKLKALIEYRRAFRKVVRCRTDFYYKLALDLVRKYKHIKVYDNSGTLKLNEDNNIKLYNNGYFNFIDILKWEGYKYSCDITVVKVPTKVE